MTDKADYLLLQSLCRDLGEVESQLTELTEERDQLRGQISEIVERLGGKATIQGFGSLQISRPTVVASYDRKGIEQLVYELASQGYTEIADAIQQHRKESMRTGGLRITRDRDNL